MNDHSVTTPPGGDGYGGSHRSGRLIRGIRIAWNLEWTDQDGCTPPAELLVPGIKRVLQKWKDGKADVIDALPLPDPDLLNSTIPISEWEDGMDGRPTPPWQPTVVAYGIDPEGGGTYTYVSSTVGGRIAIDQLDEAVETKRLLAGAQVMPRVRLSERPMKTKYGMKGRPHFEIVGWWKPGDGGALPPAPAPLQLPDEAPAPAPEPAPPAEPAPARVPVAETEPPAGRKRGSTSIGSGKKALKEAAYSEHEAKRPDSKPVFDDDLNDLAPFTK